MKVATVTGAPDAGRALVDGIRARLAALAASTAPLPHPTVACLEWTSPLFAMGNWGPELIEIAGGRCALGTAGAHSTSIAWQALADADPDVIVIAPCGFGLARTLAEMPALVAHPGWRDLRAVRDGRVFVADGNLYFNRSGRCCSTRPRSSPRCCTPNTSRRRTAGLCGSATDRSPYSPRPGRRLRRRIGRPRCSRPDRYTSARTPYRSPCTRHQSTLQAHLLRHGARRTERRSRVTVSRTAAAPGHHQQQRHECRPHHPHERNAASCPDAPQVAAITLRAGGRRGVEVDLGPGRRAGVGVRLLERREHNRPVMAVACVSATRIDIPRNFGRRAIWKGRSRLPKRDATPAFTWGVSHGNSTTETMGSGRDARRCARAGRRLQHHGQGHGHADLDVEHV